MASSHFSKQSLLIRNVAELSFARPSTSPVLKQKIIIFRSFPVFEFEQSTPNQIFCYTHCITPKYVTSLRGPTPRHCVQATQLLSKKCRSGENKVRFDRLEITTSDLPLQRRTLTARPTSGTKHSTCS